eukprot:scaffold7717_cov60-Phaeocystis_antarctica.AAC.1
MPVLADASAATVLAPAVLPPVLAGAATAAVLASAALPPVLALLNSAAAVLTDAAPPPVLALLVYPFHVRTAVIRRDSRIVKCSLRIKSTAIESILTPKEQPGQSGLDTLFRTCSTRPESRHAEDSRPQRAACAANPQCAKVPCRRYGRDTRQVQVPTRPLTSTNPSPSLVLRLGAEDELEALPRPGGRRRARLGGGAHWARLGELERGHGGEERVDGGGDEGVDEGGQQLLGL